MGTDDRAVVDPELRVRGIEGLRIADASVFPLVPSSNIHPAVLMLAERAAEIIPAPPDQHIAGRAAAVARGPGTPGGTPREGRRGPRPAAQRAGFGGREQQREQRGRA